MSSSGLRDPSLPSSLPSLTHSRDPSSGGVFKPAFKEDRELFTKRPGARELLNRRKGANGLPVLAPGGAYVPAKPLKQKTVVGEPQQAHLLSVADQEALRDARKRLKALSVSSPQFHEDSRPKTPSKRSLSRSNSRSFLVRADEEGEKKEGEGIDGEGEPFPVNPERSENELLGVAFKMGMCRMEEQTDMPANARAQRVKKSSPSWSSPSPLGLQFKTFESLLDIVKDPSITTSTFVQSHVIPKTLRNRSRYIDLVSEKMLDNPTIYVVHTWGVSFVDTVAAVQEYVTQLRTNIDDVYVWMDVLCVNQHMDRSFSDLGAIKEVIQGTDRVLVVLDRHGIIYSRMWCLWEVMQAQSTVGAWDKLAILPLSWCWDDMLHCYQMLDISRAKTTRDKEAVYTHTHTHISRDKEAAMLVADLQKSSTMDVRSITATLKDGLMQGARRELGRSEKLSNVNTKRFLTTSTSYALMLHLTCRYAEAEAVVRQIVRTIERFPSKEVTDKDQAATIYHLASILKEQGRLPDAERALQDFLNRFRGMQDELYMEGVSYLVEILTQRKLYTKAEMLTRKSLDEKLKLYGKNHPFIARSLLQLSSISLTAKLYEECEGHVQDVIQRLMQTPNGARSRELAMAYHALTICAFQGSRVAETKALSAKSLELCHNMFGPEHPLTLDAKALQAEILIRERRFAEAEELLQEVYQCRSRAYGPEHHTTLASMGHLSDLFRLVNKQVQCDEMDSKIIQIGKQLLKSTKIDKFQSLAYTTTFLARRDHLLDKAAMFLAKAFTVFKHKLTNDHELVLMTRNQLTELISKVKAIGADALEQAQLHDNQNQFAVAEVMYKQAYSVSKLVQPEDDHKHLAQCLSDALFGQGKLHEGKIIMRVAGLTRKGMSQNMPASYLRWMNTRVAKYMDNKAHTGMFDSNGEDDSD